MVDILGDADKRNNHTSILSESILFILLLLFINQLLVSLTIKLKKKLSDSEDQSCGLLRSLVIQILQPTIVATTIGIIAGYFLSYFNYEGALSEIKKSFSDLFMILLLPPILFESAINMKQKVFFKNIGTIMCLAILVTLFTTTIISLIIYQMAESGLFYMSLRGAISFGAMISATDPVAVLSIFKEQRVKKGFYILLFGESILNDAISLILYDTVNNPKLIHEKYYNHILNNTLYFVQTLIVSVLIGFLFGSISLLIIKFHQKDEIVEIDATDFKLNQQNDNQGNESQNDITNNSIGLIINHTSSQQNYTSNSQSLKVQRKQYHTKEITIMLLIPQISYLVGEFMQISGIVCIMFCGIFMARYTVRALSSQAKSITKNIYQTIAYLFENLVFLFIGISYYGFKLDENENVRVSGKMIFTIILIIMFSRLISMFLVSKMVNLFRTKPILNKQMLVLWFCGFRGAMAFALALQSIKEFSKHMEGGLILTFTVSFILFNIYIQTPMLNKIMEMAKIQRSVKQQNENKKQKQKESQQQSSNNILIRLFQRIDRKLLSLTNGRMQSSMQYEQTSKEIENGEKYKDDILTQEQNVLSQEQQQEGQQEEKEYKMEQKDELELFKVDSESDSQNDEN